MATPDSPLGTHDLNDVALQDLESTSAALEGGVSTLTPGAALRTVRMWEETLRGSDRADLHPLADLLAELHDALSADRLDGPAIGDLLLQMGDETSAAAADADDERLAPALDRLAGLLTSVGQALTA